MKKWILLFVILFLLAVYAALSTKFHYPELPFSNKTKQEVAKLAVSSELPLSKVAQQDGYVWLVTDDSLDVALNSLKQRMKKNGWEFVEQYGSSYMFEKNNEKVFIGSQQWTSNFLLFQLPIGL
ncbi:hypothetical protein HMPREF1210_03378 [Paenisporosarcina sp. HGH0030]|uniref:hypothetical protein n=1 Tax=Paenisporosarcina sp. HGH0030 TaxID=1078085 RepID=UPI00034E6C10|nr:hypothetical protein [Paenisporosarcina sp. HGH0030]EPD49479.1 hypothetical protein HMPREF1210_03378 [Paenisporosarcina sp. HGH0030]